MFGKAAEFAAGCSGTRRRQLPPTSGARQAHRVSSRASVRTPPVWYAWAAALRRSPGNYIVRGRRNATLPPSSHYNSMVISAQSCPQTPAETLPRCRNYPILPAALPPEADGSMASMAYNAANCSSCGCRHTAQGQVPDGLRGHSLFRPVKDRPPAPRPSRCWCAEQERAGYLERSA